MKEINLLIALMCFILAILAILGTAGANTPDAEGELDIKAKIIYMCDGNVIPVDECNGMTHTECCALHYNGIETQAGDLEPIDMQDQWLEEGENLE